MISLYVTVRTRIIKVAFPGSAEYGACWFMPIYPEVRIKSFFKFMFEAAKPEDILEYPVTDSLRPTFIWEAFPRPRDITSQNQVTINKITNVTYDLKI